MNRHPSPLSFFAIVFLLALFFGAGPALAQGVADPVIDRLTVVLWPEYDRPEVLVMLRGQLDPATPLPAQVTLPLPLEVGAPHAVAWRNEQGGLMVAQHSRVEAEDRALLHITVPSGAFQAEYYAPLERDGDLRRFELFWPAGPEIRSLAFEIQQPPGATDVQIVPLPGAQRVGGDGLTYQMVEVGSVTPGKAVELQLAYRRSSEALTASALAPPAPPPPPVGTSRPALPAGQDRGPTQWWPVYVAGALLVGVLVGMAMSRRKQ